MPQVRIRDNQKNTVLQKVLFLFFMMMAKDKRFYWFLILEGQRKRTSEKSLKTLNLSSLTLCSPAFSFILRLLPFVIVGWLLVALASSIPSATREVAKTFLSNPEKYRSTSFNGSAEVTCPLIK